jgi:hypothetical protein
MTMYFFLDGAMSRLNHYKINEGFLNNVKKNIIEKEYKNTNQNIFFYKPKRGIANNIVIKANKLDTSSREFSKELKLSNKYFMAFIAV